MLLQMFPTTRKNLDVALGNLIGTISLPLAYMNLVAQKALSVQETARELEASKDVETTEDRIRRRLVLQQYRYQKNLEDLRHQTLLELEASPPTMDAQNPIDEDWVDAFSKVAETWSSEAARRYFARLLVGEIKSPGSFARATIDVLGKLTPDLAEKFSAFCNLSTTISGIHPQFFVGPYENPSQGGITGLGFRYSDLCDLRDAGIIQEIMGRSSIPLLCFTVPWICGGRVIDFVGEIEERDVKVNGIDWLKELLNSIRIPMESIQLTRAGRELFTIQTIQENGEYLSHFLPWLDAQLQLRPHKFRVKSQISQTSTPAAAPPPDPSAGQPPK